MNSANMISMIQRTASIGAVLAALTVAGCHSAPPTTISETAPPTNVSSPAIQNNPNVPAFIKNGGLDRIHQQMLNHARSMQKANK